MGAYAVCGPIVDGFRRAIAAGRPGAVRQFACYVAAWTGYLAPRGMATVTVDAFCARTVEARIWLAADGAVP